MLTIFGNLYINNKIKLQHLKDSFRSFENISDNWLINIRGECRNEAMDFLKINLGSKMIAFDLLDDSNGWSKNSLDMIKSAKYDYILTWNEDHMNLANQDLYGDILKEMAEHNADYLMYSWYPHQGSYEKFPFKQYTHIDTAIITKQDWKRYVGSAPGPYILTTVGIYKKGLLIRLLTEDTIRIFIHLRTILMSVSSLCGKKKNRCFYYLNRFFFKGRLPKFPKEVPHNLEKEPHRTDYLPLIFARPKQELFACIDDDNSFDGSCLIKRGLYSTNLNTHPSKF
jgi:hypothetical protein